MSYITLEQFLIALLFVSNVYFLTNWLNARRDNGVGLAKKALKNVKETEGKLTDVHKEVDRIRQEYEGYLTDVEQRVIESLNTMMDILHRYSVVLVEAYETAQANNETNTMKNIEEKQEELSVIYSKVDDIMALWPEFYKGDKDEETRV